MTTKKHKLFYVWQFEREADYIQAMAHQGLKLTKTNGFVYSFEKVDPMPGVVKIDYKVSEDLSAFKTLLADSGWQILASHTVLNGAWIYCYNPDSKAALYSDNQSKIDLLKLIRTRWSIFGVLVFAFNLFVLTNGSGDYSFDNWISDVILGLLGVLLIIYVINFVLLTRKINRLNE